MTNKYCRICWNDAGWKRPTGTAHESKGSYTYDHGFGHEEWLFNFDWQIDGYMYGYLQPIAKYYSKYIGTSFDIYLYTLAPNKDRLGVGIIKNAYFPDQAERDHIYSEYESKGIKTQMEEDLHELGVDGLELGIVNIKYLQNDLEIFDPMPVIIPPHVVYSINRYVPLNWTSKPLTQPKRTKKASMKTNGTKKKSEEERTRAAQKGICYDPTHDKMQNRIYDLFCYTYGKQKVHYESQYVDLIVNSPGGDNFIEIKTANTAKQCIRQAVGQLLEYSHYPSTTKANKLYVIGDAKPTKEDDEYLIFLKRKYKIPIYYRQYKWDKDELDKKL